MDRARAERARPRPRKGPGAADNTDGSQVHRPPHHDTLLSPERCVSVELDHSLRERVQSHLLSQNAPGCAERHFKETQSRLSAAADHKTEDLQTLEKQRQELLYINQKWAEQYETMTKFYKDKVREQRNILTSCGEEEGRGAEEEERLTAIETHLPQSKNNPEHTQRGNCDVSADLLRAEREAGLLRVQYASLTRRGQRQQGEIQRLNEALMEALQTPALAEPEVSSGTQQELWRHQAQVYKEDFLKERSDREKLKEKHTALEERFRKVYTELKALKSQVTWTPTMPRPAAACVCTRRARSPTQAEDALHACSQPDARPLPHNQRHPHPQKNTPPS